jgi:hypothetical protein
MIATRSLRRTLNVCALVLAGALSMPAWSQYVIQHENA